MHKVAVVMGSKSDLPVVQPAIDTLRSFGVTPVVRILSAHRTPAECHAFASGARGAGISVIIAAAGKAAHLAGVIAGATTLPVIGLPVLGSAFAGMDSLLSVVQMPAGVPVACVAVNGAENAALLAVQMLAIRDGALAGLLDKHKAEMTSKVLEANQSVIDN
ncbi:MAG: 5-(carboxyamino)imidazole ribonucleotide mutase [Clostridiales bacterium]|nr:5-(carboxyamino)imidazole ribonucleotide mutase [Clostridiales bacterium]